ncbi:hypothetical protein AAEX63_04305 [Luteococcus sp. H138]|uniref:hypothetical protein n=1 Tax=unclassified Luteococcus TaxID=2639923 RepID=UPI00313CED50
MRTTVDLPAAAHDRVCALAAASGRSISATLSELTLRGLATLDEPVRVQTDPVSRLPVISIGRRVTAAEVSDFLDQE